MSSRSFRLSYALLAAALLAGCGSESMTTPVQQGATVGPAGGIASSTAPSNSQGTPSGGTGDIATERTGPPVTTAAPARTRRHAARTHHRRRVVRHNRRPAPPPVPASNSLPNNVTPGTGTNQ